MGVAVAVGADQDTRTGCTTEDPAAGVRGAGTFEPALPPPAVEGEHGSSVASVDVRPSVTLITQSGEVKLALVTVKVPSLRAVPRRVPSTEMGSPGLAPLPCT